LKVLREELTLKSFLKITTNSPSKNRLAGLFVFGIVFFLGVKEYELPNSTKIYCPEKVKLWVYMD
jgi:hypothetical protein